VTVVFSLTFSIPHSLFWVVFSGRASPPRPFHSVLHGWFNADDVRAVRDAQFIDVVFLVARLFVTNRGNSSGLQIVERDRFEAKISKHTTSGEREEADLRPRGWLGGASLLLLLLFPSEILLSILLRSVVLSPPLPAL